MPLEMGLPWELVWSLLLHLCLVPEEKNSNPVKPLQQPDMFESFNWEQAQNLSALQLTSSSGSEHLCLFRDKVRLFSKRLGCQTPHIPQRIR